MAYETATVLLRPAARVEFLRLDNVSSRIAGKGELYAGEHNVELDAQTNSYYNYTRYNDE
jgi:hypothetical protein